MKKYLKRFFTITTLIVIPLLIVMTTQNRVDHNTLRIEGFYQEKTNSIDVVFIGSSEVYTGFSPALAYGKYGFTSYHYAVENNYLNLFPYCINEVLKHQNPKVIVVDVSGILDYKTALKTNDLATMRKITDVAPFSQDKIELINQMVSKDRLSYYIPSILYHGDHSSLNWTMERLGQQIRGFTYLKGITSTNQKKECKNIFDYNNDCKTLFINSYIEKALNDFLHFCDSIKTKVIFVRFPHRTTNKIEKNLTLQVNFIEKLIKKNGFDFLNMDHELSNIHLETSNDFSDNFHLNIDGQKKLTNYLSRILVKNYDISKTPLSKENKDKWGKSYRYIKLFYKYYNLHKTDDEELWFYENTKLLHELDELS